MNVYGHSQEPTDDSVLEHEGLADLVRSDRGSRVWDGTQVVDGVKGELKQYRSTSDALSGQEFETTRGNLSLPSLPFLRSPPPALYHSGAASTSSWNSRIHSQLAPSLPPSSNRSSRPSLDYPPPRSFRKSSDPYSSTAPTSPDFYSSSSNFKQEDSPSFNRKGEADRSHGLEEENKVEWVPSLDRDVKQDHEFEGVGGVYQHGVGYEREATGSNGKKTKLSEEKLASRIQKLERKFVRDSSNLLSGKHPIKRVKEEAKAIKDSMRREKMEQRERSGVDEKGRLVVNGVKKRKTMRWLQALGAIVVGIGSIGASMLAKPKEKPPPAGTIPLIVLYVFPFASLLITTYLFVIRPCLFVRRNRKSGNSSGIAGQQIPGAYPLVQGQQPLQDSAGWCSCFGGARNRVPRGGSQQAYQPTSINLIVDPSFFATNTSQKALTSDERIEDRRRRRRKENKRKRRDRTSRPEGKRRASNESDLETDLLSSSSSFSSLSDSDIERNHSYSSSNPRSFSSILSHVALEERWLAARKQVKWNATVDVSLGALWGGVGVWAIGFNGKHCPMGGFEGYCNLYNTALAFSILLSVAFWVSFAFDCLDLSRTKVSPRHRQQRLTGFKESRDGRRRSRGLDGMV